MVSSHFLHNFINNVKKFDVETETDFFFFLLNKDNLVCITIAYRPMPYMQKS